MEPLLNTLRRSLSQHYRGNKMIGTLAMQTVKDFFKIQKPDENTIRDKEPLEGYVKNNILFLKTSDQAMKIEIFKQKKKLIALVNDQLSKMEYIIKIKDIITK